jgi:hypothetical protein
LSSVGIRILVVTGSGGCGKVTTLW